MDSTNLTLGLAFLAGLASFLSPCVLPLVPAYVGYLGRQAVTLSTERHRPLDRVHIFAHAFAFVVGFSLVFTLLGVAAGSIGQFLHDDWLRYVGGAVMAFFGLVLIGLIKFSFFYADTRRQ